MQTGARHLVQVSRCWDFRANQKSVCAVLAVIEQESSFQMNPLIPNLGAIASREIDRRARSEGLPLFLVHTALELKSSDGRTYAARIRAAHTEKDLSDIYEDFIRRVPLGPQLFDSSNPIRTRGPMQVNVAFARRFAAQRPYPYPIKTSLEEDLFTRRGSLYFGIAHLLAYNAPYDEYLYRFADYNAGQSSQGLSEGGVCRRPSPRTESCSSASNKWSARPRPLYSQSGTACA